MYSSCSKTGTDSEKRYTFEEAVIAGWAEDGGMIWPEEVGKGVKFR
jgi:hypothetical protein